MQPCWSYEEAVKHGQEVIKTYLEIWRQNGLSIPEPSIQ